MSRAATVAQEEVMRLELRRGFHLAQQLKSLYLGDAMSVPSMSPISSFRRQCERLRTERGLHDGAWFVLQARIEAREMTRWVGVLVIVAAMATWVVMR